MHKIQPQDSSDSGNVVSPVASASASGKPEAPRPRGPRYGRCSLFKSSSANGTSRTFISSGTTSLSSSEDKDRQSLLSQAGDEFSSRQETQLSSEGFAGGISGSTSSDFQDDSESFYKRDSFDEESGTKRTRTCRLSKFGRRIANATGPQDQGYRLYHLAEQSTPQHSGKFSPLKPQIEVRTLILQSGGGV